MKVTVYIHPNDRLDVEVPDDTEKTLVDEHPQLSDEDLKPWQMSWQKNLWNLLGLISHPYPITR